MSLRLLLSMAFHAGFEFDAPEVRIPEKDSDETVQIHGKLQSLRVDK